MSETTFCNASAISRDILLSPGPGYIRAAAQRSGYGGCSRRNSLAPGRICISFFFKIKAGQWVGPSSCYRCPTPGRKHPPCPALSSHRPRRQRPFHPQSAERLTSLRAAKLRLNRCTPLRNKNSRNKRRQRPVSRRDGNGRARFVRCRILGVRPAGAHVVSLTARRSSSSKSVREFWRV
jgi:hypothetical protein